MLRKLTISLFSIGILVFYSCSKDELTPSYQEFPLTFNFLKSEFKGDIVCYDTSGNIIDYVSPNFIRNDFLFSDGYAYPYDLIEVADDNTVLYYYTIRELRHVESGLLTVKNDTFYFFSGINSQFIFKGIIDGNYLRIPAYGYMISSSYEDFMSYSGYTRFGEPDIQDLVQKIYDYGYSGLFIQKFDLLYEINRSE